MHVYRLYTVFINIPLQNGPVLSNHIVSNALHKSETKAFNFSSTVDIKNHLHNSVKNYGQAEMASLICAQ